MSKILQNLIKIIFFLLFSNPLFAHSSSGNATPNFTQTSSMEPQISLPPSIMNPSTGFSPLPLPITNPYLPPPFDSGSYYNWPYSGRPQIYSPGETAFPQMICPLVDNNSNNANADIMTALRNLNAALSPTQDCQNDKDIRLLQGSVNNMTQSAQSIYGLFKNPELISIESLPSFDDHLKTILQGVDNLGTTLNNNSLLGGNCGKQLITSTQFLVGMSELMISIAPFTLLAAAANPTLKIWAPWILGLTGVLAIARILNEISTSHTIEIHKPEVRDAVLRNLCEFIKLTQRVRFLELLKSNKIKDIGLEFAKMETRTLADLYPKASGPLQTLLSDRDKVKKMLQPTSERNLENIKEIQNLTSKINESTSESVSLYCSMAKTLAKRNNNLDTNNLTSSMQSGSDSGSDSDSDSESKSHFPSSVVVDLYSLIQIFQSSVKSVFQEGLFLQELDLRTKLTNSSLLQKPNYKPGEEYKECADFGASYILTLNRMSLETRALINRIGTLLNKQLNKNSEYKKYSEEEEKIKKSIQNSKTIVNLLETLNQDNNSIQQSEIHAQMQQIYNTLFKVKGFGFTGKSPVEVWLNFFHDKVSESLTKFLKEFEILRRESRNFLKNALISDLLEPSIKVDLNQVDKFVLNTPVDLNELNFRNITQGTTFHTGICRQLENAWMEWISVVDYLKAESFLCENIQPLASSSMDKAIISHCWGENYLDVSGNKSRIQRAKNRIKEEGFRDKAIFINDKMKELACTP